MKVILIIDAVINSVLGVLLLLFSPAIVGWLGVPPSSTNFYLLHFGRVKNTVPPNNVTDLASGN
jgi:hypothetical protein